MECSDAEPCFSWLRQRLRNQTWPSWSIDRELREALGRRGTQSSVHTVDLKLEFLWLRQLQLEAPFVDVGPAVNGQTMLTGHCKSFLLNASTGRRRLGRRSTCPRDLPFYRVDAATQSIPVEISRRSRLWPWWSPRSTYKGMYPNRWTEGSVSSSGLVSHQLEWPAHARDITQVQPSWAHDWSLMSCAPPTAGCRRVGLEKLRGGLGRDRCANKMPLVVGDCLFSYLR